ncbi:MAG: hypothetical protein OEV93_00030 [Candidatus Moranbacteria bacterium]|nr:hypothetical protein [Candidatus Moranbacteria bacterium]
MTLKKDIEKSVELMKEAIQITWKNGYLWWFGLVIAISEDLIYFATGAAVDQKSQEALTQLNIAPLIELVRVINQNKEEAILGLILISSILIIINIASYSSILISLKRILKNQESTLKSSIIEGRKFVKKIIGFELSLAIFLLSVLVILALPIYLLKNANLPIIADFMFLGAILIFIPIAIISYFTRIFGHLYLVQHRLSIKESFRNAYSVFSNNLRSSFTLFASLIIILMTLTLFLVLLVNIFSAILLLTGSEVIVKLGMAILIIFDIIVKAAMIVFQRTLWVIFFNKITIRKDDLKEKVLASELQESTAIAKEQA